MVLWVENRFSDTSLKQPDYSISTQVFGEGSTGPAISESIEIHVVNSNVSAVTSNNMMFGPLANYPADFANVFLNNVDDECVGASVNQP